MFVDASAIVAIMTEEPGWQILAKRLEATTSSQTSPVAAYEAVLALARKRAVSIDRAKADFRQFLTITSMTIEPITADIADFALDAFERYGKGRHRAALNMGDCFSYACAKARRVPLLFKGDDFGHTDIAVA